MLLLCFVSLWTAACAGGSGAPDRVLPEALGLPVGSGAANAPDIRVLRNPGFVVGFDRDRGRAAWVAYHVTPVHHHEHMPRPRFETDPRVRHHAPRRVYHGPAYDRGHMAPNYAISQLYGRDAQRATFYFSNVEPQSQRLNQLLWQRLEEIEIDYLAPRLGTVWVIAGPIHADDDNIPDAFFRIWLARGQHDQWQVMAFRVPQDVRGDERLDQFLVSVDAIETATGLNFFPGLSPAAEQRIESRKAKAERWAFDQRACMPARYRERWQGRQGVHLDFDRCD